MILLATFSSGCSLVHVGVASYFGKGGGPGGPSQPFSYYCSTNGFVIGDASNMSLAVPAAPGAIYAVSPPLPPGLSINPATGTISGSATATVTMTPYVITATNGTWTQSTVINLKSNSGFTVNDFGDTPDMSPGDDICATSVGTCTLRAAIAEINAEGVSKIIALPPGQINLATTALTASQDIDVYGSCGGTASIVDGGGAVGPLYQANTSGSLNNLTIQNGFTAVNGGGILISGGGFFSINNAVVQHNNTSGSANGAGLYVSSSGTTAITSSLFQNDSTGPTGSGGAIYQFTGTLSITGTVFNNNTAVDSGGAIFFSGATINISTSSFTNNSTPNDGGAMEVDANTSASISTTWFANNAATTGGALFVGSSGPTTLLQCSFTGNSASSAGGALYMGGAGSLNIYQSDMVNNSVALAGGGGMYIGLGVVSVANSTIAQNYTTGSGSYGGGIGMSSGTTLNVYNSTIAQNVSGSGGGGALMAGGANYSLNNSIFYGNTTSGSGNSCSTATGGSSNGFNIFDDNSCFHTTDLINTNADLGPLQSSGGILMFMIPNPGSPVLGTAALGTCMTNPVNGLDEMGNPRGSGSVCDMGAYQTSF